MKFVKMHGLGNDYIYINLMEEKVDDLSNLAVLFSDRHFGIGGDGIITISSSDKADFFMQIYNADGSKGEMCGNGIRCVGKYVYEKGLTNKEELDIETLAGVKHLKLNIKDNEVESVKVDMGVPTLHNGEEIALSNSTHVLNVLNKYYEVVDVSVGNPHAVLFVPEITDYLVNEVGALIECNPYYPNRTNVEFVKILSPTEIEMRVYERGSGETMACGTGSCASVVAFMLKQGIRNKKIKVKLRGGDLYVQWKDDNHIIMEGPATYVFAGEIDINDIINK